MSALSLLLTTPLVVSAAVPRVGTARARTLPTTFAAVPLAAGDLRSADRAFLEKAAETLRQQMRLAEVGVSQAESADVRSHAAQVVGDYRTLEAALQDVIQRKGGIAGAPTGGSSENNRKLLEKSGREFDREFVRAVAALSDSVLTLFEQAAANSKDDNVRSFASAQLPLLRDHRSRAVALRQAVE